MPKLFTVRWPRFARLEALLLFPVSLVLASEIAPVRTLALEQVIPFLSPYGAQFGISKTVIIWISVALIVALPYFALLLAVDRFLTIRKGYALLSVIAIAVWAGTAMHLSDQLANFVPDQIIAQFNWLPLAQEAALTVGGVALLLHLWPLWVGLRDDGDVALRLIVGPDRRANNRADGSDTNRLRDVYYRQTADFRGWQQQEQLSGLEGVPKENPAVKVLYALTWVGVVVALAAAYQNWGNFRAGKSQPAAEAHATPQVVERTTRASAASSTPVLPLSPLTQGIAQGPQQGTAGHVVAAYPLPAVNRPTEMVMGLPSTNAVNGPNEAIADRLPNGSFAFDAVVNGNHVAMMFDTGASVVAIRAEDAARLGINVAKLNYSARVKTANGTAEVAPVIIETLTIGNITLHSVVACVAKEGTMQINLLGQTFLARLSGFNVENNELVLRGR